ncbi:MAG: signal peptidase [Ilumatobacteraceae bacterium]
MTDTAPVDADEAHDGRRAPDDRTTARRIAWFAGVMVVLLVVRAFVAEPVRVHGNSMEPTLPAGALLLIDKLTFHARDPRRGDVVVTTDPRNGGSIVKRVVAVAGDSVGLDDGVLMLNGAKVVESYVDYTGMEGFYFGPDVVPSGHVFLLGDNRLDSVDSRAFGPVAVDDLDGKLSTTLWPPG